MTNFEKTISFDSPETASEAIAEACSRASRHISIFSQQLHANIYSDALVVKTISDIARKSRFSKIRTLIVDPRPLYGKDVPLIRLTNRLPTHMAVRVYVDGALKEDESYICIDKTHWIHIANEEMAEGVVHLDDRARTRRALENFDYVWQSGSKLDPNFKNLTI